MRFNRLFFIKGTVLVLCSFTIFLTSCAKASNDPDKNVSTAPAGNTSTTQFNWSPGSGSSVTADSSSYYVGFTTIFAFKNGTSNSIEINLSSLAVGSYTVSGSTGNAVTYVASATTYTAKSGLVNITANSGTNLSGNFNCVLDGGTLTSLSGQFVDIPKR